MGKLLFYFMIIRFRKLFSKGDSVAVVLMVLAYIAMAVVLFYNYKQLRFYSAVFLLECMIYHWNRKDIELLKLKRSYKILLLAEYLLWIFPFVIVWILKSEWVALSILPVFIYGFISLPKWRFTVLKYPFRLVEPFWTIVFRKYKLLFFLPCTVLIGYLAIQYKNDNLFLGLILLLSVISSIPSFEKEREEEIKRMQMDASGYLRQQWRVNAINAFYLVIPVVVILIVFQKWNLLSFAVLPIITAIVNVILRYVFFKNTLLQQLFFVFYIGLCITYYGIPLLAFPLLYKRAINEINTMKYAEY